MLEYCQTYIQKGVLSALQYHHQHILVRQCSSIDVHYDKQTLLHCFETNRRCNYELSVSF